MNPWIVVYFGVSALWLSFFIRKRAFRLNKVTGWLGALSASALWPLGFIFLVFQFKKQHDCEKCRQIKTTWNL